VKTPVWSTRAVQLVTAGPCCCSTRRSEERPPAEDDSAIPASASPSGSSSTLTRGRRRRPTLAGGTMMLVYLQRLARTALRNGRRPTTTSNHYSASCAIAGTPAHTTQTDFRSTLDRKWSKMHSAHRQLLLHPSCGAPPSFGVLSCPLCESGRRHAASAYPFFGAAAGDGTPGVPPGAVERGWQPGSPGH
jgi:hypothetical protein